MDHQANKNMARFDADIVLILVGAGYGDTSRNPRRFSVRHPALEASATEGDPSPEGSRDMREG